MSLTQKRIYDMIEKQINDGHGAVGGAHIGGRKRKSKKASKKGKGISGGKKRKSKKASKKGKGLSGGRKRKSKKSKRAMK